MVVAQDELWFMFCVCLYAVRYALNTSKAYVEEWTQAGVDG